MNRQVNKLLGQDRFSLQGKTELQKEFIKEQIRLQKGLKRAEKQGYVVSEDLIPKLPKRVTKQALEKIKKTKPSHLYKVKKVKPLTGRAVESEIESYSKNKTVPNGKTLKGDKTKSLTSTKKPKYKTSKRKSVTSSKKKELEGVKKDKVETKKPKKPRLEVKIHRERKYYPTVDIIEQIRRAIHELERKAPPPFSIEQRKNELISIFENTLLDYYDENDGTDGFNQLREYLKENEAEIFEGLEIIMYASDSEQIEISFANVGRILNVTSLNPSQEERLSEFAESGYFEGEYE